MRFGCGPGSRGQAWNSLTWRSDVVLLHVVPDGVVEVHLRPVARLHAVAVLLLADAVVARLGPSPVQEAGHHGHDADRDEHHRRHHT